MLFRSFNASFVCNATKSPKPKIILKEKVFFKKKETNQNLPIVSSSSGSSILSLKDLRSFSIQDGCNVIGSARGIMDYYGGKLSCPLTGVSLLIPTGAIKKGIQQEIYFQVCQENSHIEKVNGRLFSPIVICGPYGIEFDKPVELILPHSAGNDTEQLSLILHGMNSIKNDSPIYLDSKTSSQQGMNGINRITNSNVSILINHF